MDKRKLLLYVLPVVILLLLWIFWPDQGDAQKSNRLKEQAERAALAANPQSGEYREFVDQNRKLFTEENMYTFAQLMEMARTGRISLVAELWKLRSKCAAGGGPLGQIQGAVTTQPNAKPKQKMNIDECNIRIENFLREQYPPPENEKIIALFRHYLRFEDSMRRFAFPENATPTERYELLKKKRREFFSESDAQLLFGYDETRTATQEALNDFFKNSANMPADERVKKYYDMRKKMLGDYNSAFNESEPAYTRYETEVLLRGDEMQRQGTSATQTEAMREKYFGVDGAKRMAVVDQQIKEERTRIDNYEAAAQKFNRENPSLSDSDRQAKLDALRATMLGQEESDAYARRMQYEEYLRQNNLK